MRRHFRFSHLKHGLAINRSLPEQSVCKAPSSAFRDAQSIRSESRKASHCICYKTHLSCTFHNFNYSSRLLNYFLYQNRGATTSGFLCSSVMQRRHICTLNLLQSRLCGQGVLSRCKGTTSQTCKYMYSTNVKDSSHSKSLGNDTGSVDNVEKIRYLLESLDPKQRKALLSELQIEEATKIKKKAEEKLASYHWRSKFGRPASRPLSKGDATGTYCEIPAEWIKKRAIDKEKSRPPTPRELRHVGVFNALPFVGFGFLDNFIMIVAGDYIDTNLGLCLGISTMAAAALGNTISDLAGIGSAWYVENLAAKFGATPPDLTNEQLAMKSAVIASNIGRAIGVVLGCFIGMFPLFIFSKLGKGKRKTEDEKKDDKKS